MGRTLCGSQLNVSPASVDALVVYRLIYGLSVASLLRIDSGLKYFSGPNWLASCSNRMLVALVYNLCVLGI